jgi:hypothetical protein
MIAAASFAARAAIGRYSRPSSAGASKPIFASRRSFSRPIFLHCRTDAPLIRQRVLASVSRHGQTLARGKRSDELGASGSADTLVNGWVSLA